MGTLFARPDYFERDPRVKARLRERGIQLTTWKELKARRDRALDPGR